MTHCLVDTRTCSSSGFIAGEFVITFRDLICRHEMILSKPNYILIPEEKGNIHRNRNRKHLVSEYPTAEPLFTTPLQIRNWHQFAAPEWLVSIALFHILFKITNRNDQSATHSRLWACTSKAEELNIRSKYTYSTSNHSSSDWPKLNSQVRL